MPYILALDQGTTSSRAIVFDRAGRVKAVAQKEFPQIFPKPGWVEHDAGEIWNSQLQVARGVLERAGASASDVAAIGITNQRETAVVWEKLVMQQSSDLDALMSNPQIRRGGGNGYSYLCGFLTWRSSIIHAIVNDQSIV